MLASILAAAVLTQAPAATRPGVAPATVPAPPAGASQFLAWLNSHRARYGLPAVAHDPNLAAWARLNNQRMESARVSGHFCPAVCYQAAFYGPASWLQAGLGWLASPGHRAILLHPSIRFVGLDRWGSSYTLNAR